jgi:hypothetical protein
MNDLELEDKIQQVVSVLLASGFSSEAERLRRVLADLLNGSRSRRDCLSEIEGLCGVKSFGDLYITEIEDSAWLKLLSDVRFLAKER